MTVTINPKMLAEFEAATLASGAHGNAFTGKACAMEWDSLLADEGFTDAPECASTVLRRYTIALNDRWDDEKRQALKPYLLRMIGTGGDGKDEIRKRIMEHFVATRLLPDYLRLAGMDDQIAALEAVEPGNWRQLRKTLYAVREAAWAKRLAARETLKGRIREELAKRALTGSTADAVADADAAADAAAAADADADAAAAADADAGSNRWNEIWRASYKAAREVYEKSGNETLAKIREIAASHSGDALELLDLLIDAKEEALV